MPMHSTPLRSLSLGRLALLVAGLEVTSEDWRLKSNAAFSAASPSKNQMGAMLISARAAETAKV